MISLDTNSGGGDTSSVPVRPRTQTLRQIEFPQSGAKTGSFGLFVKSLGVERAWGFAILIALTLSFIIVPFFAQDPNVFGGLPRQAPSSEHWFGTDWLGRDMFSRIFHAGRIDLTIVLTGVGVCLALGTFLGLVIANSPRAVRAIMMRVIDAFLALPFIIIVVVLVNVIGHQQVVPFVAPSVGAMILAIAAVGWAPYARLTVGQALILREREHVVAAKLLGYGRLRILVRHVAPSVMGVNASYAASQAVGTVGLVASLAFLGAGIQEPTPDLGAMMSGGLQLLPIAPWITLIPGMLVLLLGIGFALVADSNRR